MRKMSYVKMSILTAACIALCVVLPMAFHAIPRAGSIILPMHIPVLLCGLIVGWRFGLLAGLAGPFLSHLIMGMPPAPVLPGMLVELGIYGLVTGLLMLFVNTKKIYLDLYICLIGAMLIGRIAAGITQALIFASGNYSLAIWATSYFATSLPGLVIQLAFLPSVVLALESSGLIPRKYNL